MNIYDFNARRIDGSMQSLRDFEGQVLLIVNVASRCGFTPQYTGLEALWRKYRESGFAVLGFPCNQFGAQEPEEETAIVNFCSTAYDITFPLFAKVAVNGDGADPLYQYLKSSAPGVLGTEAVKWNFTKFLIASDGRVASRHAPTAKPAELEQDIEGLLSAAIETESNDGG